jgi:CRP-like cAMP-binding protein
VPAHIHLLLDGGVIAASSDGPSVVIEPAAALGFHEALQGQPMLQGVRTEGVAVTLVLAIDELRTLLADNTDLVSGLFTTLSDTSLRDQSPVQPASGAAELERLATGGLTPIEKVLALQRVPLFERASAEEMRHVAELATTVPFAAGGALFNESAAPALWLLLSGEVTLKRGDGAPPLTAIGGDVIGATHAMAGVPLGLTATATRDGIVLRIARDELFDILGERPELLRQMFAALFRRVADPALASGVFRPRVTAAV